jgi:hypothetical protein
MRLRCPRFTVRRMMVAVALLGLALGFLAERRARFLRIAARYEQATLAYRTYGGFYMPRGFFYDLEMESKYKRAARYPWLPVMPDPPEPNISTDPIETSVEPMPASSGVSPFDRKPDPTVPGLPKPE